MVGLLISRVILVKKWEAFLGHSVCFQRLPGIPSFCITSDAIMVLKSSFTLDVYLGEGNLSLIT